MGDINPREPRRPLFWPDFVSELQGLLSGISAPLYIVGGAVRNALIHRPLHDLDLATPEDGSRIAREIANRLGGDFYPLDKERGVGRALVSTPEGRFTIDVARFRGDTLLADLSDRDFALNAMAVDLAVDLSLLIDPLDGEDDAIRRIIRRCSPTSIDQDPIRALRAVRQSVELGCRIEPATLADIRRSGARLIETSPERIRDEFIKVLQLPKAVGALRVLDTLGLLALIIPETTPLHGFGQSSTHILDTWEHTLSTIDNLVGLIATINPKRTDNTAANFSRGMVVVQLDRYRTRLQEHLAFEWPNERSHQALLCLAALLQDSGKPFLDQSKSAGFLGSSDHESAGAELANVRGQALRLSTGEIQRLTTIVQNHTRLYSLGEMTPRAIHRFWRALGPAGIDVCLLAFADTLATYGSTLDSRLWLEMVERVYVLMRAYFDEHSRLVVPPVLVDGNQLMQTFTLKPGPLVGELLDTIREAQVAGEVVTAEDALACARSFLDNRRDD